ncbi:MAG: hypothetical protein WC413_03880 [Candidatus Nanoarchaeia archaeon]
MKTLLELKKELQDLQNKHKDISDRIETQNKIDKLKEQIILLELKKIKPAKKVNNPVLKVIKTIFIGFGKTGKYIWNNGLKGMFEHLGRAGIKMHNLDNKKKK